ncbi:MAG: hypothetical protein VW493_09335, partial [Gammaproteobacteria bacterium]
LSRHLAGASVLSLVLIIAGCSSGQSTTGSALSKEATACYSEYVDLHGDIKKAYKAQISSGIASQSEYGKAHYEGMGANEGRALPQGCGEHLQVSSTCYEGYVDNHSDLTTAWQASGQDKGNFGKTHYDASGKTEGRALPKGCGYEYTPPPVATVDPAASYTDDQILAYMNCYPDLRNIRSTNAEKIAFGKAHIRAFGQTEGRTCGLVAAVAEEESGGGGGGGPAWSASGTLVDTKTGNSGTDFDAWGSPNGMMTENFGIQYQPAVDTKITSVSFWMKNWTGGNGCVLDAVAQPFIAHIIAYDTVGGSTSGGILASSNEGTTTNSASYVEVSATFTTTPVLTANNTYLILYTSNGTTGTQSNLCYSWERTNLSDSEVIRRAWLNATTVTGSYTAFSGGFSTKIVGSQFQ